MNPVPHTVTRLLATLALLAGAITPARAAVVTHLRPFGLMPLVPVSAVAIRLPAGNAFALVGLGITDGNCAAANVDCLLADRGWAAVPTVDDHIAAATGPALTDGTLRSWAALAFSADPVLSPLLDLDLVLFGPGRSLLGGYRWELGYDSSRGSYELLHADYSQWQPTWGQVFAVPLPGTLPLALAALALVGWPRRLRACR
jgi:hypothetical protein